MVERAGRQPRDGLAFADRDATFVRLPPDFCTLTGLAAEDWTGRNVKEVFDVAVQHRVQEFVDTYDAQFGVWTHYGPLSVGSGRDLEVALYSIPDPQGRFVVLSITDPDWEPPRSPAAIADPTESTLSFEQTKVGLAILGLDREVHTVNEAACRIFGRSREELLVHNFGEIMHPEDRVLALVDYCRLVFERTESVAAERRYHRPDGTLVWVQDEVSLVRDAAGRPHHYLWHLIDITARKRAEEELRDRERRLDFLTSTLPTPIIEVDQHGRITSANEAAVEFVGQGALVGVDTATVIHPDDWDEVSHSGLAAIGTHRDWTQEFRIPSPEGDRWVRAASRGHFHPDGSFRSITSTWTDITDRKLQEADLEHRATKDPLTGLLNRSAFTVQLEGAHQRRAANAGSSDALLFIDLDGFKQVNDTDGHAAGDRLLQQVGNRLSGLARTGDVVGRWGGDEFVVLCRDLQGSRAATEIAQRIVAAMTQLAPPSSPRFGASVGVAFIAEHETIEGVVATADAAVYEAKAAGGGAVRSG